MTYDAEAETEGLMETLTGDWSTVDRELLRTALRAAHDAGAERMRERASARALACLGDEDDPSGGPMDGYDRWDAVHYVVEKIRALPLTEPDDA